LSDLVSPGNFVLVKQGMRMKIVATERLEWPPPYRAATEKYAFQVKLNDQGELDPSKRFCCSVADASAPTKIA
jgi:hypothetical protein